MCKVTIVKGENTHMTIKAVKFRKDGFYSQPFAFGGEEGMDPFDKKHSLPRKSSELPD